MAEVRHPRLVDRFPALEKLALGRPRKGIPYVQQTTVTDCGAACLAMVLAYHGRSVGLNAVREVTGISRDGIDALCLLEAGRHLGLRGRGLQLAGIDELRYLDRGTILHWQFNHFVVFDRIDRRGARIVDPAIGPRVVERDELDRSLTGVALAFEPGEEFTPGTAARPGAARFLRALKEQLALLSRIVVVSVVLQLAALSVPILTGVLVDRVVPRGDLDLLAVLAVGMAGLLAFKLLASLIRSFLLLHLRTRLDVKLTLEFLEHLVALPYRFFQQRSTGDLMMRLQSNSTLRDVLTSSALSGMLDGAMVSVYLVLLFLADPRIGLLVAGLGAINVGIFLLTRRRQRELTAQSLQAQADCQSLQVEMLTGIETLKVSGTEDRVVERWSDLYVKELNVSLDRGRLDAVVNAALEGLSTASPLLILLYGGYLVLGGAMSLGTLLALNALAIGFLTPLSALVATALQMQMMGSYLERIDDVMETPREQDVAAARRLGALRGRVVVDAVTFAYGPLVEAAVHDVSCRIEPGEIVAVVGASGSGKSTLAGILAGLYRPDQGRVLYDGVDLNELDLRWLRRQIGFVAQQPHIFGGSIRANIALADPELPLSAIVEAARQTSIHEDIARMPMAYETVVADGGSSLSGGQRQRLALARALVREPRILILDEATSALDAVTERQIHRNLKQLRCTRILIAHRLSTVRDADQILVMHDGRIVESGSHEELLELGGRYRQLVGLQLRRSGPTKVPADLTGALA